MSIGVASAASARSSTAPRRRRRKGHPEDAFLDVDPSVPSVPSFFLARFPPPFRFPSSKHRSLSRAAVVPTASAAGLTHSCRRPATATALTVPSRAAESRAVQLADNLRELRVRPAAEDDLLRRRRLVLRVRIARATRAETTRVTRTRLRTRRVRIGVGIVLAENGSSANERDPARANVSRRPRRRSSIRPRETQPPPTRCLSSRRARARRRTPRSPPPRGSSRRRPVDRRIPRRKRVEIRRRRGVWRRTRGRRPRRVCAPPRDAPRDVSRDRRGRDRVYRVRTRGASRARRRRRRRPRPADCPASPRSSAAR